MPTEEQIRAAAAVLAPALYRGKGWEREPEQVRDRYVEAALPLAEDALRAAEGV